VRGRDAGKKKWMARGEMLSASELAGGAAQGGDEDDGAGLSDAEDTAPQPVGVTLRARWVTLRARWVTLRARWVTLRARWVTLRARWVTLRAR
jgi:hypothetical protein